MSSTSHRPASKPPKKRLRTSPSQDGDTTTTTTKAKQKASLFAPFRTIGHFSTEVPFVLQSHSSKFLQAPKVVIVTCLGTSWAMWEGEKLQLLFVGPETPTPITSLAIEGDSIYAATANQVRRYVRGKEASVLSTSASSFSKHDEDDSGIEDEDVMDLDMNTFGEVQGDVAGSDVIGQIIIFGAQLVGLAKSGKRMWVWDLEKEELFTTINFPPGFTGCYVLHPATYINKVLVGSQEGELQIWNVRTSQLIHTFPSSTFSSSPSSSTKSSPPARITQIAQSPAIDVIGVGLSDGTVSLFDVKLGEELGRVRMNVDLSEGRAGDEGREITGLAFRTDNEAQLLATSSRSGHIAIWDLNDNFRLLHILRAAHDGVIGALGFIPGQPVMFSSGGDNSIKQWLFPSPLDTPHILRQRSGHHGPPHLIRYYGEDGKNILSAGQDRSLRCVSVVRDVRGYELSQGSISKKSTALSRPPSSLKYPPITSLSFSTARSKEWDDLLTVHSAQPIARTWSVSSKRKGKYELGLLESRTGSGAASGMGMGEAKSVCVTSCGNFGLVGWEGSDEIGVWNLQSGIRRRTFRLPRGTGGKGDAGDRSVVGLAVDALNSMVVVGTLSGNLHFIDFHTSKFIETVSLDVPVVSIILQRDNGLLAVSCDDMAIRIVDIETRKVVRELVGFRGRILDMTFSPDSRWLVVSSIDSVIRTFDIPTGQLVDAFKTPSVATSVTFSPTGDFLATSHVNSLGISLWANRAQFTEVSLRGIKEEDIFQSQMPSLQGEAEGTNLQELTASTMDDDHAFNPNTNQLSDELLTLSLVPRSRWQTLLNLDTIKQRNKPKEPPKAPERAPFFLPTLPGTEVQFDVTKKQEQERPKASEQTQSHRLDFGSMVVESEFTRQLRESSHEEGTNYDGFFAYVKGLSPSSLDLEIRSFTDETSISLFLDALLARLDSRRDFEAVQALLGVLLNVHGEILIDQGPETEIGSKFAKLLTIQEEETRRLTDALHFSLGTIAFIRNAPIA